MSTAGDIALGAAGIVVTLLTFWLGYRKTIGAKQERAQAVNDDVEAIVTKQILLGESAPTFDDLSRLIAGKAIASGLHVSDLRSVQDLVLVLWARVFENDLVPPARRQEILSAVFPITEPAREISPAPVRDTEAESEQADKLIGWIAAAAGALGIAVSVIPLVAQGKSTTNVVAAAVAAATAAVIAAGLAVYRIQSREERPHNGQELAYLTTYPDRDPGLEALHILDTLSPLAASAFASFATDEQRSLREGVVRGLFVRPGGTWWHTELVSAGLLEPTDSPAGRDAGGRQFLVLTDTGRSVARLILAKQTVPDWLASPNASEQATEPDSRVARGSAAHLG